MNVKKSDKVNLEKKRGLFLQIGFIVAISVAVFIFENVTEKVKINAGNYSTEIDIEIEMLPVLRKKDIKPPIPKTSKMIMLELVPDDVETEDTTTFDAEISETQAIDMKIFTEIEDPEEELEKVEIFISRKAHFPGGDDGLKQYFKKAIIYPQSAIEDNIQGKVNVKFVVNQSGEIENAKVIRSIHPLLDEEALRVVNSMPTWKPALQNGEYVSVWRTLPVSFVLSI